MSPTTHYWRIWTDADGVSRQTRCAFTDFERQSMDGAVPPDPPGTTT